MFQKVAVVGATGAVGRIMLQLLAERNFPAKDYKFLASARSAGHTLEFLGKTWTIEELRPEAFQGCDLVIASTPDDVAAKYLPYAIEAGMKASALADRLSSLVFAVNYAAFGVVMILFLIFEPLGLVGIWRRVQNWLLLWPFKQKPLAK